MARTCPHCGMDSDRDKTCSWCNKPLTTEKPASAASGQSASAGAQPAAPPPLAEAPAAGPPAARPAAAKSPAPRAREPIKQPPPAWIYIVGALVVLLLLGVGMNFAAAKKAAGPPLDPADWKALQSKTKLLTLQGPGNWKFVTAGSSSSYEQAELKASPLCAVTIHGSQGKGSVGDIMGASSNLSRGSDITRRPEGKLHAFLGMGVKKEDPSYSEGELDSWTFAGMPAAYCEYTRVQKVGLFKVKMKGWRLACSGGDLGYDIRAEAPEQQWGKFQGDARKVLENVSLGTSQ